MITIRIRTCKLPYPQACTDTYAVPLIRDDNEKAVYITAYEKIIKFIPGLKKYLPLTGDGDLEKLHKLLEVVSHFNAHISP